MKAVVITRPGGPEVLELRDLADPDCRDHEVLVRVRACALNRADLLQRRGLYASPPGKATVPGLEFAGEVETVGARVRGLRPGDRVLGLTTGGAMAEKLALPEGLCLRIPPAMSWEHAAAIPEAFITAYDALFHRARLAPGEATLVHAAASGVGLAAIQLGTLYGGRVIALSRSPEKRQRLESMGLLAVFDARRDDLGPAILDATTGRGVDVVLDLLGKSATALNLEVLRDCGRVVVVGLMGGTSAEIDLRVLMSRRLSWIGTVLATRGLEERVLLVQEFGDRVLPLFAAGRIRPVIHEVLPLEAVARAHGLLERNETFGKVVLEVGAGG